MKTLLSNYWKTNKAGIKSNWRHNEFIREKHNFSILAYIQYHVEHMREACNFDIDIATIEKELYTTI